MKNVLILPLLVGAQFLGSFIVNAMSYETLGSFRFILRARPWEKEGRIYRKIFKINRWKDYVPEFGRLTPMKFSKRRMLGTDPEYLRQFILESIRAELCHLIAIFASIPILIFVSSSLTRWAVLYVVLLNIPCIMIQRTNRPRLEKILKSSLLRASSEAAEPAKQEDLALKT